MGKWENQGLKVPLKRTIICDAILLLIASANQIEFIPQKYSPQSLFHPANFTALNCR